MKTQIIKLGIVIAIIASLITVAALEQHFIQGTYNQLETRVDALIKTIETMDEQNLDINTPENIAEIESIYQWWLEKERSLSMLARHFDLAQVSVQIVYAKNFIIFNNAEEAMVGLRTMSYLIKTHSFNIGTSVQNVI